MFRQLVTLHKWLLNQFVERVGTTSTPYVTAQCTGVDSLFPPDRFRELAAVTAWRQAIDAQRRDKRLVMQHQPDRRSCVDRTLESMLSWCQSRWRSPISVLPPGDAERPDRWRETFGTRAGGYVNWPLFTKYFNALPADVRSGQRLEPRLDQDWDGLQAELSATAQPVMVSYMLSPIPWIGRVVGRLVLGATYLLDRIIYWLTMACGHPGFSPHREWFLKGDDDIHLCYLHCAVILGLFADVQTGEQFVLLAEPWGGDAMSFSGRSAIFEVLSRSDFEARWKDWSKLCISSTIRARWYLLGTPGTLFVLRDEQETKSCDV